MKTAVTIAVALVVLSSFPLFGQQASAGTQTSASASASAGRANVSQSGSANTSASASRNGLYGAGSANSFSAASMRPVQGELVGNLDAKHAKVGDPVVVKTTQAFTTAEGTRIPKGSKLIGHVSEAQAHGSGSAESRLGLVFDQAEMKGGESMPIHAVIESVSPSASAIAASQMQASDDMGPMGGGVAGGGRAMGGGALGGGVARGGGGLVGGAVGGATSATAGAGSSLTSETGSTLGAAGNMAGGAAAGVGNSVRGSAGAVAGVGSHVSTVPGVALEGGASSATSGVLTASKRNVHLDSGTQMTLGVAGSVAR